MSNANIELVRKAYEAFNRRDLDALRELGAPNIEVQRASGMGTLRGITAVAEFMAPDAFDWQQLELQEIIEHGGRMLVALRARARGTGSGVEVEQEAFHVITMRDGQLARVEVFFDRSEALEALHRTHAG